MIDRDKLKPDELEAMDKEFTAATRADHVIGRALSKRRYLRAKEYLDDGQWQKVNATTWKRSYEGDKITFNVAADRVNIAPAHKQTKTKNLDGGAEWVYDIMYNSQAGFGPNVIDQLQVSTIKRDKGLVYAPKELPTLMRLHDKQLKPQQQLWNAAIPPNRETLEQWIRWHPYDEMLYWYNPDREEMEYVFDDFIELNGQTYACWRVASQLMFNNPNGWASKGDWKKLLDAHAENLKRHDPIIPKPIEAPPFRYRRSGIKYIPQDTPERKALVQNEAVEKERRDDRNRRLSRERMRKKRAEEKQKGLE